MFARCSSGFAHAMPGEGGCVGRSWLGAIWTLELCLKSIPDGLRRDALGHHLRGLNANLNVAEGHLGFDKSRLPLECAFQELVRTREPQRLLNQGSEDLVCVGPMHIENRHGPPSLLLFTKDREEASGGLTIPKSYGAEPVVRCIRRCPELGVRDRKGIFEETPCLHFEQLDAATNARADACSFRR